MKIRCLIFLLLCFVLPAKGDSGVSYFTVSGKRILDENGLPVFFNGDTPWHLSARLNQADTITYLDNRAAKGYNAMIVSLIVADGYSTGSPNNVFGEGPFTTPGDFATPNEAYFAHIDWMLDQMWSRGITCFLWPLYAGYGCGGEGWCAEMQAAGTTKLRAYGQFLGQRYADFPGRGLVWVQGGDVTPINHNLVDLVDAVAYGIKDFDTVHLHTAHSDRQRSALDDYNRPWLDFNTTYSECVQSPVRLKLDWERNLPTVYIEGKYEDGFAWSNICIRSQAYWALLSGAAGHFYGHEGIWDFPDGGWATKMNSPANTAMQAFGAIAGNLALVPDFEAAWMTTGSGDINGASYGLYARSVDNQTVLIYLPSSRSVTFNLVQRMSVFYIDPVDGTEEFKGSFGAGAHSFTRWGSAAQGDWLLKAVVEQVVSFGSMKLREHGPD